MPHRCRFPIVWTVICSLSSGVPGALAQGTPAGRYAAGLVDAAEYRFVLDEMLYTRLGHDRRYGPQHDLAQTNIRMMFENDGLDTQLHPFVYNLTTYFNVVAELRGTVRPDEVYIIGAHYDSVGNPGADDNASGVAGVLEIARLVSQWQADATIRFIAFDREEQGLIGSDAYATDHRLDDIRGMISMDMIAYAPTSPSRARVYGRSASAAVKNALAGALLDYAGITATILGTFDASDHAPFEWQGFGAALLIEYDYPNNPHYHRATDSVDTPGYINYEYAAAMTRATMGWLVEAAGVRPDYPLGDLNGSYTVDADDCGPMALALTDLAAYQAAYPEVNPLVVGDLNQDGAFDGLDLPAFVGLLIAP